MKLRLTMFTITLTMLACLLPPPLPVRETDYTVGTFRKEYHQPISRTEAVNKHGIGEKERP